MSKELGIRYCSDSGMIDRMLKLLWNRLDRRVSKELPKLPRLMRPMALKNIVYLPYKPGCDEVRLEQQVDTAIHEPTHCIRVRIHKGSVSNWYGQYIVNPNFRAIEEAIAQLGVAEFKFWQDGQSGVPFRDNAGPPGLSLDRGYCLTRENKITAQNVYDDHIKSLVQKGRGFSYLESSAAAIRFFRGQ
jgi:hypothetical protein